jgi:hypothetical protein
MADSFSLSPASTIVRIGKTVEADVDGEVVALHIERGICFGLNKVGSRVWRLASSPVRISDICTILLEEYEISFEICVSDVIDLLDGLREQGLIDLIPEIPSSRHSAGK